METKGGQRRGIQGVWEVTRCKAKRLAMYCQSRAAGWGWERVRKENKGKEKVVDRGDVFFVHLRGGGSSTGSSFN